MSTAMVGVAEGQDVMLAEDDPPVAELVACLHEGRLRPGDLSASQRQQCVDYLTRDERIAPNSRLWAESVIVQNFQRFIETTHRLHYMADGKKRLDRLVAQDPTELDRQADAINRNLLILDKAIERGSKRK